MRSLEEIYEDLPKVNCKGLCASSCGPIDMSTEERRRIAEAGVIIPLYSSEAARAWDAGQPVYCPALDLDTRQCTVYALRPLICRAWGAGRGEMACPHGCEIEGPRLRAEGILALMNESYRVGGHEYHTPKVLDAIEESLKYPEVVLAYRAVAARRPGAQADLVRILKESRRGRDKPSAVESS